MCTKQYQAQRFDMKFFVPLSLALFLCGCVSSGYEAAVVEYTGASEIPSGHAEHYRLASSISHKEYRISVISPADYSTRDDGKYPTFYIYDAVGENFSQLVQLVQAMDTIAPPTIWVGIGPGSDSLWDAQRNSDLTPTTGSIETVIASASAQIEPISGGAPAMLNVLTEEIMPFVQDQYRTSNEVVLGGHSFAGLFAAFAFIERPDLFGRVLLASPSLWWDNEVVQRSTLKSQLLSHPSRVFLSVGGGETEEMITSKRNFESALLALELPNLDLESVEYPEARHNDTVFPSFMEGVPFVMEGIVRQN